MSYASLFNEVTVSSSGARAATTLPLSDEQAEAYNAPFDKSAVICAGAGAGKTRLLVERVARLLRAGADPKRIAVVTFTKKSAVEVSSRILAKLVDKKRLPVCSTVHALALSLLVKRGETFNLATPAQEYECFSDIAEFLPAQFEDLTPTEALLSIHRAREEGSYSSTSGLVALAYEEALTAQGVDDFTSLLLRGCELNLDSFDHIVVDEAQDLSNLQLRFLRAIGRTARFWFIGDPDQAIYSFRGAHSTMMHRLRDECDLLFTLATNYRSARSIVVHANNVICNNPNRFPVVWKTSRELEGSVTTEFHEHGSIEAALTMSWLESAPQSRCVLARTQALVAPFKAAGLQAMSVHESKGLEWPEVKIIGCEAALFPHPLSGREEERRLFYVAMTRARDNLILSCSSNRSHKNPEKKTRHPSAFLYETQALIG